jgi:hypothetical protein
MKWQVSFHGIFAKGGAKKGSGRKHREVRALEFNSKFVFGRNIAEGVKLNAKVIFSFKSSRLAIPVVGIERGFLQISGGSSELSFSCLFCSDKGAR